MKPIWIVDDDQSIRFVLEKALLREELPTRSFTNAREVLQALERELDVRFPERVVIGAGAVVTKSITQSGIYAGNPARLLRFISE